MSFNGRKLPGNEKIDRKFDYVNILASGNQLSAHITGPTRIVRESDYSPAS